MEEFKALKKLVKSRYHHLAAAAMWRSIISKHHSSYQNILLIVELILCIEWASSTVERRFSTASRLLVPSRRSLGKDMVNDLLMLRINLPVLKGLDENYEEKLKLITKAVENYVPGKYHHTKSSSSTANTIQTTSVLSEDLFLPIQRRDLVNPLLADDNDLTISDDDECVSDDEMQEIAGEEETWSDEEQNSECEIADDDLERCSSHDDSDIDK